MQAVPPRAAEPVKQELPTAKPAAASMEVIALDDDDETPLPKMTAFKAKMPVVPAVCSDPSAETMARLQEEILTLKRKLEEKEASEGERSPVVPKTLFTPRPC